MRWWGKGRLAVRIGESWRDSFHQKLLWNEIFPAMLVNKDVTAMGWWGEGRDSRKHERQASHICHSLCGWGIKDVNNQEAGFGPTAEMHTKGMNSVSPHAYTSHTQTSTAAAAAKSLQLCLTLCDLIDGSPWGSPVPGINPLSWDIWFSLMNNNLWIFRLPALSGKMM